MTATVYAPQEPMRWDDTKARLVPAFGDLRRNAARWGQLKFLTGPNAGPWTSSAFSEMWEGLAQYSPARDYLLFVGNPGLIAAMAVLAERRAPLGTPLRALQWNGKHGQYFLVQLDLPYGVRQR